MHKTIATKEGGENKIISKEEEAVIKAKWAKNQADSAALKWFYDRKEAYGDIYDQLDMIWHDIDDGLILGKDSNWFKACKEVKTQHPKPE